MRRLRRSVYRDRLPWPKPGKRLWNNVGSPKFNKWFTDQARLLRFWMQRHHPNSGGSWYKGNR